MFLERLSKSKEKLLHDSRSPVRDLDTGAPKYEAGDTFVGDHVYEYTGK
jgi:hypothetical protein